MMSQTTLSMGSAWASLDHTFRSVSNIGLVRLADNRWVKTPLCTKWGWRGVILEVDQVTIIFTHGRYTLRTQREI